MTWTMSAIVACIGIVTIPQGKAAPPEQAISHARGTATLSFSEEDIRGLIARIEQPGARSSLKYRYFASRRHVACPRYEGCETIKAAFDRERPGTDRWFCLGSVAAFGATWVGGSVHDDWCDRYTQLLDAVGKARVGAARDAVRESVLDIAGILARRVTDESHLDVGTEGICPLVLKALRVWIDQPASPSVVSDPRWMEILRGTGTEGDAVKLMRSRLARPGSERDLRLVIAAASVLAVRDPSSAVDVLRRSLPSLSQRRAADACRVYGDLVSILLQQKRIDEAIQEQDKLVSATGRGRALLAMLYKRAGDDAGFNAQLRGLEGPASNEDDIGELADMLLPRLNDSESDKASALKQLEELISSYLDCDRRRTPVAELHARVTLADILMKTGRLLEAARVLASLRDGTWPTDGAAGVYLRIGRSILENAKQRQP